MPTALSKANSCVEEEGGGGVEEGRWRGEKSSVTC